MQDQTSYDLSYFFPTHISQLLSFILNKNYTLIMIGGGAREFLDDGMCPLDLDFELGHVSLRIKGKSWVNHVQNLITEINQQFNLSAQMNDFGVTKIDFWGHNVELSLKRVDVYSEAAKQIAFNHEEFTPRFFSNIPVKESFNRRDLTINAFGFDLSVAKGEEKIPVLKASMVDPFQGLSHWKQKLLVPVDLGAKNIFFYDPVRFLRLLRFRLRYNLSWGPGLDPSFILPQFNLEHLTIAQIASEAEKIPSFFNFFKELLSAAHLYRLYLSNQVLNFLNLAFLETPRILNHQQFRIYHMAYKYAVVDKDALESKEVVELLELWGVRKKYYLMVFSSIRILFSYEKSLWVLKKQTLLSGSLNPKLTKRSILLKCWIKDLELIKDKTYPAKLAQLPGGYLANCLYSEYLMKFFKFNEEFIQKDLGLIWSELMRIQELLRRVSLMTEDWMEDYIQKGRGRSTTAVRDFIEEKIKEGLWGQEDMIILQHFFGKIFIANFKKSELELMSPRDKRIQWLLTLSLYFKGSRTWKSYLLQ